MGKPDVEGPTALVPPVFTHGLSADAEGVLSCPLIPDRDTIADRLDRLPAANEFERLVRVAQIAKEIEAQAKRHKALAEFQRHWRQRALDRYERVRAYLVRALLQAKRDGVVKETKISARDPRNPAGIGVSIPKPAPAITVKKLQNLDEDLVRFELRTVVAPFIALVAESVAQIAGARGVEQPSSFGVACAHRIMDQLWKGESEGLESGSITFAACAQRLREKVDSGIVPLGCDVEAGTPKPSIRLPKTGMDLDEYGLGEEVLYE